MSTTTSPNMNLVLGVPTVELGPAWAIEINTALQSLVDAHDHSTGKGVQVTPAGFNMSSDLNFNTKNATALRSVRFNVNPSALTAASPNLGCLYIVNADLYYNDGSGNQVRITQGGAVTGASGTITGLPSGTASAAFSGSTFTFLQATSTAANLDVGSLVVRYPGSYPSPSGNYIAIEAPTSLSTGYALTLPAAPPASSAPLIMDTSGTVTASTALYAAFCPTGVLLPFAGSSAPTGWLLCNGAAISRSTYSALFSAIGTAFGIGDGSTTFNIPNTQGVFLRGAGSQTISAKTFTATLGTASKDTTAVNGLYDTGHLHTYSNIPTGNNQFTSIGGGSLNTAVQSTFNTSTATAALAGDGETRPANIGVNYIIKT